MLELKPFKENAGLSIPQVVDAAEKFRIIDQIKIAEIDPALSDTSGFCETYDVPPSKGANCIILRCKKEGVTSYAAVIVLATTRADINGKVREILNIKKVSFAAMEDAVNLTGMEYGAINPIGLPEDWPILVDKAVTGTKDIIIGSGVRCSKLQIDGDLLEKIPNVQVVDNLAS